MRAPVAVLVAVVVVTTGCATPKDEGNLQIRCPDAGGAVAVVNGQVAIDAVVMRVAADLTGPATVEDDGLKFAVELQLPRAAAPITSPAVECVRISRLEENARWDATPSRIEEVRNESTVSVRATRGEGPHWRSAEVVDVTVWVKMSTGRRHVLALGHQRIHG